MSQIRTADDGQDRRGPHRASAASFSRFALLLALLAALIALVPEWALPAVVGAALVLGGTLVLARPRPAPAAAVTPAPLVPFSQRVMSQARR